MKALSLLLIFTIFLPTAFSLANKTTLPLVAKLIHHNSIQSPFFDPNVTPENQHRRERENFLAYLSKLKLQSQGIFEEEKFRSKVVTHLHFPIFVVQFQIGEPPIAQAAALDTGSSHFWIHCYPCEGCVNSYYAVYDPEESATYEDLECFHYLCADKCKNEHKECEYFKTYLTGYSEGKYAYERFAFSYNNTQASMSLVFGCSQKSKDAAVKYSGILGLGMDQISLLSQVGAGQFSYCIGNLSDPTYKDNVLIIAEEPIFDGTSTPFSTDGSHYITNLEGISLGGEFLDIDEEDLRRTPDNTGGAIFDSGASSSILQGIAYKELEEKVIDVIGNLLERTTYDNKKLCFKGNLQRDFNSFPTVRFHFAEGATMEFDKENIFKQARDGEVCLNVENADNYKIDCSLIGVNLQQYFYVEFDIKKKRLGFQRMDCNALWNK